MKWLKASLLLALSIVLIAGCSSNTNNQTDNSVNTNASSAASNSANDADGKDEKVHIKYYTFLNGTNWEYILKIVDNFEKEYPNIDVEPIQLVDNGNSTDFYKKLDIMMATEEPVDVVMFSHVDFVVERAARGVLAPMDAFLEGDEIDAKNDFYITPTYDGSVYGLQDAAQPWFVAINKKALDEANLSIPEWGWTWDDFREYAKKLTKGEGQNKQYGAYFHTWGEYANFPAYSELLHPYLTEGEQLVFDDPTFKQFFELRRAMEKEDSSVKTYSDIIGGQLHYASEFFNGEAAMVPIGSWILGMAQDTDKFPHDFQTVFAPLPRSSEKVKTGSSYIGGGYLSIGASSKHKEEAYTFIQYAATQTDVIRDFPGYKNVDSDYIIESLVGDHGDMIDAESLKATVFNDQVYAPYNPEYSTSYSTQLKNVLQDGFSSYILEDLTAEEAIAEMIKQGQKIQEQAK